MPVINMKFLIVLLLLFIFLHSAYSSFSNLFTFNIMGKLIKAKINTIIDRGNIEDTKCATDLKMFVTDLSSFKLWAAKMMDASGKINSGILYGNYYQIGNYEECLSIDENQNGSVITGQYCNFFLLPNSNLTNSIGPYLKMENLPKILGLHQSDHFMESLLKRFKLTLGICIPKSCSSEHLQNVWNYTEKIFKLPVHGVFEESLCLYKGKSVEPYSIDVYVMIFFSLIIVIVLASTIYEYFWKFLGSTNRTPRFIFVIFSLYSNTKHLLSTDYVSGNLTCLHGIKVLSMLWIILSHTVAVKSFMPLTNSIYIISEWKFYLSSTFFMAGHFGVDNFFAISGILVVYVYSKYLEKSRINLFEFYIHRSLRVMPALIAIVLFYLGVYKHVANGPFWPLLVKKFTRSCHATWWATLFSFSNFINLKYQCVEQAWYLSIDTQLYIVAPIIVFNINKYPKKVIIGIISTCLVSFIYTFSTVINKEIGYLLAFETNENDMLYIYHSVISRMPSWLIGTVFGYLIYQNSTKKIKISKNFNLLLWSFSCISMVGLILYHHVFATNEYSAFRSALHNTLARPLWALAVCLIIYSCCMGHGGFVNAFLSHPVFMVCSKLVYCMFLVHFVVISGVYGNQKTAGHFSNFDILFEFCGILTITLLCSVVLCLVFEMPILVWVKHSKLCNSKIKRVRVV